MYALCDGLPQPDRGTGSPLMFVFFSNRLGCFGSLVVSAIATLILLLIFGVIEIR